MIPQLLRRAGAFRWYWVGQTVSLFGDQITYVAVPLVAVLYLHASPAEMGYLVAAAWLPYLLFALQAGALVDRYGHRRLIMIGADLGRALLLLTVPAAAALHHLALLQLYAVIFLSGTLSTFFNVSMATLFVSMLEREDYLHGQSLLNGSRAFSFVGGPAVAGTLVQAFSGPVALVVDAFSFLVSALCLGRIRPVEPAIGARRRSSTRLSACRKLPHGWNCAWKSVRRNRSRTKSMLSPVTYSRGTPSPNPSVPSSRTQRTKTLSVSRRL